MRELVVSFSIKVFAKGQWQGEAKSPSCNRDQKVIIEATLVWKRI
jgi:hypothetical protein